MLLALALYKDSLVYALCKREHYQIISVLFGNNAHAISCTYAILVLIASEVDHSNKNKDRKVQKKDNNVVSVRIFCCKQILLMHIYNRKYDFKLCSQGYYK